MALSATTLRRIREHYLAGTTVRRAADAADCSYLAVRLQFIRLAADGVTRGTVQRQPSSRKVFRSHLDPRPPRYIGPSLIGKAITPAPLSVGPDWIGLRIAPRSTPWAS